MTQSPLRVLTEKPLMYYSSEVLAGSFLVCYLSMVQSQISKGTDTNLWLIPAFKGTYSIPVQRYFFKKNP